MYQLSATLKGHSQDVKDLISIDNNQLASVSRDGSVRLWSKLENSNEWDSKIVFETEKFLNSITYDSINEIIYFSGKDCLINGCKLTSTLGQDPLFTLIGHKDNVCSLNRNDFTDELISGSWDKSANIWSNGTIKYSLTGHQASIWDAKFIPNTNDEFITVSADKSIRLWTKDKMTKSFTNIHNDVVRNIEFIPYENNDFLFATCSNDTTIKLFNRQGDIVRSLEGHESFVYSMKYNSSTSELVSCGEDRSVRIWDCLTGDIKQVLRLPAISIWCVDILPNNDIIVGCSDNTIRIFTNDDSRIAKNNAILEFQKEVQNSSLNSQTMNFDESKLSSPEVLTKPGNKEGQIVVVKTPSGALEAHQYSNGNWSKVGEVVGSSGTGSDKKVEFEGKEYDYVFDVDIEEGKPPLKLPINTSDNPYDAADKFIMRYELPSDYRDQIVNFIIKNTSGISLDNDFISNTQAQQTQDLQGKDYSSRNFQVLPAKNFLSLTSFNPDTIFNGIVKLNEKEHAFNDGDIAVIGSALNDLEDSSNILFNYAKTIRSTWLNKTPAYDIIRLIVHKLPETNDIAEFIEEGLGNKDIRISMLTVRILANCFQNTKWGIQLMASEKVYNSVFETIDTVFENQTQRQAQNLAVSVATLIFNYSVLVLQDSANRLGIVPVVAEAMNNKFGCLEEYQDSEEAAYRLVVAYGNFSLVEPALRQVAMSVKWLNQVKNRYISESKRFADIISDLN